jgi:DNA-binding LytR/AlgR family response regulator
LIRCIIVEDETLAQQVIQSHLDKIDTFELVGVCSNALEAKEILSKHHVDLIFLDIQLPGMTGLNFLRSLQNPPLVVLTTAYSEYALESYEFNVIDYLLKPVSFERFFKAVNKITEGKLFSLASQPKHKISDHIFIRSEGKFFRVNFSDIIYIESMKDYLKIHAKEFRLIAHHTMNDMEKVLPANKFIRVHKSYIVSTDSIKTIYGNSVETSKAVIPIGNNYKEKVMSLIGR